jgi:hypothetical protein
MDPGMAQARAVPSRGLSQQTRVTVIDSAFPARGTKA